MFGFLVGTILFLLSFFQIIYSSYLWPFLLPFLVKIHKKRVAPSVNLVIYGLWSFIILIIGILTLLNFFVSDYGAFLRGILNRLDNDIISLIILLLSSMIAGNIIRICVFKWVTKQRTHYPKEVNEALKMLDDLEQSLDNASFWLVRDHIEKVILAQPNKFADLIRRGTPLRVWIFSAIANTAGDLVESGNYHIYRGTINPLGPGFDLLKLFDMAIDELVKMKVLKEERAKEEKRAIRENIKNVG